MHGLNENRKTSLLNYYITNVNDTEALKEYIHRRYIATILNYKFKEQALQN